MLAKSFSIRNLNAGELADRFVVSAVAAILLIRLYLEMTGYPQIGGGGLHIAHMLWGGLLMAIAIIILLSFMSAGALKLAAIVGGIGFGTFIDELGKFITSDNNYFFQPTISLIYVIFVLLYLGIRYIERYRPYTEREYLVNAIEALKEAIIEDLDAEEERRAKQYLAQCNPKNPLVPVIGTLIDQFECVPPPPPSPWTTLLRRIRDWYPRLIDQPWFPRILFAFFTLEALATIAQSLVLTAGAVGLVSGLSLATIQSVGFSEFGGLLFSLISGIFVIIGVVRFHSNRLTAYRMFRISVLISLLLVQFFQFYDLQFGALFGFTIDWITLILLTHLIERERTLTNEATDLSASRAVSPTGASASGS